MIYSSDRLSHFYYRLKQRAQDLFILCCTLSETKGMNSNYESSKAFSESHFKGRVGIKQEETI